MKALNIILLILVLMIYFIPLIVISIIAIVLWLFGICQDFTSVYLIVKFIRPITYLEDRIKR